MAEGPIVECVPNFSEGVDREKVEAIVRAMRVDGVHLLDYSLDGDHNRSVVTIAGVPEAVVEAAIRGSGKAAELIDLRQQ
jgi:glutamate formiminotransferase